MGRQPIITILQLVEEDNIVVAEGAVKCKLKMGDLWMLCFVKYSIFITVK
jgi:hypothetical protein